MTQTGKAFRKIISTLLCIAIFGGMFAGFQNVGALTIVNPSVQWIVQTDGSSIYEGFRCVRPLTDGGTICAGSSFLNGTGSGNASRLSEAILQKFSSSGACVWRSKFGGTGNDYFTSVAQLTSGDFVAVGYTFSTDGDCSGLNGGKPGALLAIYSSSGTLKWKQVYGESYDQFTSVTATKDGGFVVTGFFYDDTTPAGCPFSTSSGECALKFSSSHSVLWHRYFGSSFYISSSAQTTDGGIVLAGSVYANSEDVQVVKLSSSGSLLYTKTIGGSYADSCCSVCATSDGGFACSGYSGSNDGDFAGLHIGGNSGSGTDSYQDDAFIAKFSSAGAKQWAKEGGGWGYDVFYSVAQTADGGYLASGYSLSYQVDPSASHTGDSDRGDAILFRYKKDGTMAWMKDIGGTGEDEFYSAVQTSDGGYIAGGLCASVNGDFTGISYGGYDTLVKITPDTQYNNDIVSFSVPGQLDTPVIDTGAHTVTAYVPLTASVKSLAPKITVTSGAAISPASGSTRDFTNPVVYTVTSSDGYVQKWTVSVKRVRCPAVKGVTNGGVYHSNVTITFDVGTATLNGNVIKSGTTVSKDGHYTLYISYGQGSTCVAFQMNKSGGANNAVFSKNTVLGQNGAYKNAGVYEYDNLTIGDNVEVTSKDISQLVIRIYGTLKLGKNAVIRVRNGYYAAAPSKLISSMGNTNFSSFGTQAGGFKILENLYGRGGDGGKGGNGTNGYLGGNGGNAGYGGSGGYGGGKGGEPGTYGSAAYGGKVGQTASKGDDNGGGPLGGGADSLGKAGSDGIYTAAGFGGGGNGGRGGNGGSNDGYGDGAGGCGGGGGGYGGGVLTIIANKIVYDNSAPPKLLVSGQKGGASGSGGGGGAQPGKTGEGGLLVINCPNFIPLQSLWDLGTGTYGSYTLPSVNGGHGIVTGGPQKVFLNGAEATAGVIASIRSQKSIISFTVPGQVGSSVISASAHTIVFHMPAGNAAAVLKPAVGVSWGASVSPASGAAANFSSPVSYTVTASDGSKQIWKVTRIINNPVVTGVANGGNYKSGVTIRFDAGTATLNGKAFKNGGTVTANGSYTLKVTCGSVSTTVRFTIKKS